MFECTVCKSTNTYTLMDGTRVCRKCGHRGKDYEEESEL